MSAIKFSLITMVSLFLMPIIDLSAALPSYKGGTQRYYSDIGPEGSYEYAYETDNGIYAEERGTVRDPNSEDVGLSVQGSYLYTSPEGIPIHLTYTADENGFHPQGDHLPTPPPIPPQILKALVWIADQKQKQEYLEAQNNIKEDYFSNVRNVWSPRL